MSESRDIALCTYGTQPRGGVVHAVALAEALAERGEDVVLFALDDGRGFARAPRCEVRLVPVAPAASFAGDVFGYVTAHAAAAARALADGERFEVYHAQDGIWGNAFATLVDDGVVPGFARTVHHLDAFADSRVAALQERSVARAGAWFAVSDLWAARLRERFGAEAAVVGNGVDAVRFSPANDARPPVADAPHFVAIGGVEPRKNALGTLEAFALVRATHPRARLTIAGGASVFDRAAYRQEFIIRAHELGVADAVDVVGECDDERVVATIRSADAVVFASLAEGFGLVALEAAACGTPLVVSGIEPFVSYLPADLATLVDPLDPRSIARGMRRALDPAVTARARADGPAFARRFAWRDVARRHLATYDALRGARAAKGEMSCPR